MFELLPTGPAAGCSSSLPINEIDGEGDTKSYRNITDRISSSTIPLSSSIGEDDEEQQDQEQHQQDQDQEQEQEEEQQQQQQNDRKTLYRKIIIGTILLIIICFVIIDSTFGQKYIRHGITLFLEWVKENPGEGVIAFIFVYFIATVLCVPGALLTLGSGFVFSVSLDGSIFWGVVLGTIAVFIGAFASAIVAFLLGRYLFHDSVRRLSAKYTLFEALDIALAEKGLRIMCLLRLSPITPFVVLNYIAGVSTVRFGSYCLANFAILPGTIFYVFLGASAGCVLTDSMHNNNDNDNNNNDNKAVTITVIVLGVTFGIFAIALTSYYAKSELNKMVTNQQQQQQQQLEEEEEEEGIIVVEGSEQQQQDQQHDISCDGNGEEEEDDDDNGDRKDNISTTEPESDNS
jgi:uncharacterized membrane protein YdjX (TVP38/TMEM64 family)